MDGNEVKSGGETEGDEVGDDDMYRYQSSTDDEMKEKMAVLKKCTENKTYAKLWQIKNVFLLSNRLNTRTF
jgi:hypothetical protein